MVEALAVVWQSHWRNAKKAKQSYQAESRESELRTLRDTRLRVVRCVLVPENRTARGP